MSAEFEAVELDPERLLLKRLQEHGLLDIARLTVRVQEGVVYIFGYVPNVKQKKLATELASRTKGICEVVNMLRVTPIAVLDDLSLEAHVRDTLSRSRRLDGSRITVRVRDGHVYLGGTVATAAQRTLAEQEVWAMPGVRDITNDIEVLAEARRSEARVIEEIREGLSDCLGLDTSSITIQFHEGIVHLKGTVPNEYSREAAEELAMWTPQVKAVINELQIGELSPPEDRPIAQQTDLPVVEDCLHDMAVS